jgi:hypothetical protein
LSSLTRLLPEARPLVEWTFERGLQVTIATNPLFPGTAIEQRLEWAGVPVGARLPRPYALVTSYEIMHATLGRQPGECLMVGNDWERDIAPAASVGIPVYWIAEPGDAPPPYGGDKRGVLVGQGTLADLWAWVRGVLGF